MIFSVSTNWNYKTGFYRYVLRQIKVAVFVHIWLNTLIQFCVTLSLLVFLYLFFFVSFEEVISFCQFSLSSPSLMYSIGLSSYQFLQGKDFSNWVQLMKNLLEP